MKIFKYIGFFGSLIFLGSCEKLEVSYQTTALSENMAEFQLDYFVPVASTSTNYIYKVEINDSLYANSTAPLSTYSAIPGGTVGKYYTAKAGTVNIKLYKGADLSLVYDQDVTLSSGKQSVFIYDFNLAPQVFESGYPFQSNETEYTDSTCYVKFYNYLYASTGVPSDLKLQYQYVDLTTGALVNIGDPVSFGETTGWLPVKVIKSVLVSAGSNTVYFKIKVADDEGNLSDLQVLNSAGKTVNYSETKTVFIGRWYQHTLSGVQTETPVASVRTFTVL